MKTNTEGEKREKDAKERKKLNKTKKQERAVIKYSER